MIKPEMVPKEAIAELRAFLNSCDCDDCVAVAIAAALNAWPGALHRIGIKRHKNGEWRQPYPMICLPLPQETRDDE